jgi:serine/threonine protein kinase
VHTEAGVDLVCGPDSPLPEGRQRYRLLHHLGAGGQAEVYRAVRLSAGVSSSPVTVKVFRSDARRPMLDQLRSWDKGDAVLMDLNSRGVAGICLRVDGFYGSPPHPPGGGHSGHEQIPYQVLDYLPGGTLIERLAGGAAASGPAKLSGVAVLNTIARTLQALHHPDEPGDSPVLHMDVKPSNIIVLPDGDVRLIDFTTARYDHAAHITTIAHTPESAGPEAYTGHVGTAYDVHGFGAVAYFLVTGWLPRTDRSAISPAGALVPSAGVRRHPLLDEHPTLAAHLLAPLADRPEDRPRTDELPQWIAHLSRLAARLPASVRFVDWTEQQPDVKRTPNATIIATGMLAGAGAGADLERVKNAQHPASRPAAPPKPAPARTAVEPPAAPPVKPPRITGSAPVPVRQPAPPAAERPGFGYPAWRNRGFGRRDAQPPPYPDASRGGHPPGAPHQPPAPPVDPAAQYARRQRGKKLTRNAALIALSCWVVWLVTALFREPHDAVEPATGLGLMIAGAVLVYWLTRLAGHLIRTTLDRGPRRGTLVPHLVTTVFLLLSGLEFLSRTPLSPWKIYNFVQNLLVF